MVIDLRACDGCVGAGEPPQCVLVITDRNRARAADAFDRMPDMTLRAIRQGLVTRREI